MLYKPRFCCHCGEKIERGRWTFMTSRRFCDVCEIENKGVELGLKSLAAIAILAGLISTAVVIGSLGQRSQPVRPAAVTVENLPAVRSGNAANSLPETTLRSGRADTASNQAARPETDRSAAARLPGQGVQAQPAAIFYCEAVTKKGTRCTRRVKEKGFCWQHARLAALAVADEADTKPQQSR